MNDFLIVFALHQREVLAQTLIADRQHGDQLLLVENSLQLGLILHTLVSSLVQEEHLTLGLADGKAAAVLEKILTLRVPIGQQRVIFLHLHGQEV